MTGISQAMSEFLDEWTKDPPPVPLVYAPEILKLADGDPDGAAFLARVDVDKFAAWCSGKVER